MSISSRLLPASVLVLVVGTAFAGQVPTTLEDFRVPGTQVGDLPPGSLFASTSCRVCHGLYDAANAPYSTWDGSLMSHAGRDPLFFAQMSTANQDAANVGYYCLRCHVPISIVSGHAEQADGSTLDAADRDGISCHFCHSLVDPLYKPGISPPEDAAVLAGLSAVPAHYGNSMFVLDPTTSRRRGPYSDPAAPHAWLPSAFHRTGEMCVTCHDVGNVETTLTPQGTYRYNALDTPSPTDDPAHQFPLERTGTEWKLSAFANGGVDMGGRFGGDATPVIETCQDCHMPRYAAQGCTSAAVRPDLARHDFAGAAAPVLDLIAAYTRGDPEVDQNAIAVARAKAVSMLERAASLDLRQEDGDLVVRVSNETGHKLPTGHIEGRRMWIGVRFLTTGGALVAERGGYDTATATLDAASTTVYEMHVGLSDDAAIVTGLPAGPTGHMSLADTILKDNRIPPRGFDNAAFAAGGAPVVGANYADGQYWDERPFSIPAAAERAEVTLYYQNTPREYIEHLRDANVTDDWGTTLHRLWSETGRGAPIPMVSASLNVTPSCTRVAAASQTLRTLVRPEKILATGRLTVPVGDSIAPSTEDVTLTLSDAGGVLIDTTLPAGSFVGDRRQRLFRYEGTGPILRARLRVDRSGRFVRYVFHTRPAARTIVPGAGTASVSIGGRCFVDPADTCTGHRSVWELCR
ncbi:MAG: hypothetical protein B6D46_07305 [Polyangiaceae bacterium UTPRO1]|jgi:hypothetical protein|nr:hypothetical protein [Myxococcales bacterium]OQY67285.1 MAG: hypothetical protein B6D46_07305 [Polyangiaceae bacterium UTPRO1]